MLGLESKDFGLVLVAIIGLLATLLGSKKTHEAVTGKGKSPPEPEMMEVAGAIVSEKKANEWIAAAHEVAAKMHELSGKIERNTQACDRISARMDNTSHSIDNLAKEFEFQNRLRGRD